MLEEFYEHIGGSYADVKKRFMTDERILRFVSRFPGDTSFSMLKDALAAGNVQDAFRAAHTLKGVAQNLGFDALFLQAEKVTNVLRGGDINVSALMPPLEELYTQTITEIAKL